jgi:anti-sigma B factor antagonist
LQISARRIDNITIFDVIGDIDLANSPEVRKALLKELKESRVPRVVMNMSRVRYIDSSGVASLVEGLKASRDVGSRFILFGLSPSAREVLQLSRLLKIFEVYEDEAQAIA